MIDINRNAWEFPELIEQVYAKDSDIDETEKVILDKLRDELPKMRMLDVGVGGGRTTLHFAELTKEYIGIDFDDNMIHACQKRFPNLSEKVTFLTCDARSMNIFENEYFDFVMFSFNGLDYLTHPDRLKALREIIRVSKKGGYFFFSSHNLNSIDRLFRFQRSRNPVKLFRALIKKLFFTLLNENIKRLLAQEHAMIYDEAYLVEGWRWVIPSILKGLGYNYYIRPEAQIKQLEGLGFKEIEVYAIDGNEIKNKADLNRLTDVWLHYFCKI